MKSHFIVTVFFLFGMTNNFSQAIVNNCKENRRFKNHFFRQIKKIDKYTYASDTSLNFTVSQREFLRALGKISKYKKVSGDMLNYQVRYPTIEMYEKEKKQWLEWYEQNKCRNIKKNRKQFYRPDLGVDE